MTNEESIWSKLVDVIQIMDAKMSSMAADMRGMRKDLKYHIYRTNKLEAHISRIEEETIKPLQETLLKFKIVGGLVITIGVGLCGLIGWLINILITLNTKGII